jgi:hypothetical protein
VSALVGWLVGCLLTGVNLVGRQTLTEIQLCEHLLTAGLVVQLQNGITRFVSDPPCFPQIEVCGI